MSLLIHIGVVWRSITWMEVFLLEAAEGDEGTMRATEGHRSATDAQAPGLDGGLLLVPSGKNQDISQSCGVCPSTKPMSERLPRLRIRTILDMQFGICPFLLPEVLCSPPYGVW